MPRTYRVADRAAQLALELELDRPPAGPPRAAIGDDYDEQHETRPRWITGPAPVAELELEPAGTYRLVCNGLEVRTGLEGEDADVELAELERAVREVRCGW
jgi:hypothetical protein